MLVIFSPVVEFTAAPLPTAVLCVVDVLVLRARELTPIATLPLPVTLSFKALLPIAIFSFPVVKASPVDCPISMFL
jgi:hypothetical protein